MADETAEDWNNVAGHVSARIAELGYWNLTELARASGVSGATWRALKAAQPLRRLDKRAEVCAALGWTTASFDSLLHGGPPAADESGAGPRARDGSTLEDFGALMLARRLDEIEERLSALEKPKSKKKR